MNININSTDGCCRLCGNLVAVKITLTDITGNEKDINTCSECEYKMFEALRDRQLRKMIYGYASNE